MVSGLKTVQLQAESGTQPLGAHPPGCLRRQGVPELDVVAGIDSAEAWIRKRVFESFEDSPAGHIVKLAGLLAPVAPGFEVSPDAVGDCGVRPTRPSGPALSAHVTWCDPLMLNPRRHAGRWYHLGRKVPMALNIKDDAVHEAVKRITSITGESQAQAVAVAVRERLARLEKDELAARLLAIGRKTASRMDADTELDHGRLLYDDRGLPA